MTAAGAEDRGPGQVRSFAVGPAGLAARMEIAKRLVTGPGVAGSHDPAAPDEQGPRSVDPGFSSWPGGSGARALGLTGGGRLAVPPDTGD